MPAEVLGLAADFNVSACNAVQQLLEHGREAILCQQYLDPEHTILHDQHGNHWRLSFVSSSITMHPVASSTPACLEEWRRHQ
jgi:hypothetical protein